MDMGLSFACLGDNCDSLLKTWVGGLLLNCWAKPKEPAQDHFPPLLGLPFLSSCVGWTPKGRQLSLEAGVISSSLGALWATVCF